ncbi:MAG: hypothetical protein ABIK97_05275 [candidate division WOR-3 bacterium]
MRKLHFNYKDVFTACRLGFSAKKMWMMFLGLLFAFLFYIVFGYLAHLSAGIPFSEIWEESRLCPSLPLNSPFYSYLLWAFGIFLFLVTLGKTGTAISKVTYEQLRGEDFYEIKESFRYAKKNFKSWFFSPILIILFILVIIICGLILGLLTKIPYVGELILALFSLPAFAASLFIVYLGIVFIFTLILAPAIVGVTKNDIFDTLFEVFSSLNEQPWRLVIYTILLGILKLVGVVILSFFTILATRVGIAILNLLVRGKMEEVLSNASYFIRLTPPEFLPNWFKIGHLSLLNLFGIDYLSSPGIYFNPSNVTLGIASVVFALLFYFLVLFVLSYGGAIWFSGTTLIYLVLVKKKDDRNLLEIKEEEIREEEKEPVASPRGEEEKGETGMETG